ncbi:hypothetical protein IEQ34_009014 [Dendrobium chrysotoxum]|uniref:Uncharacterized protein n=1 Tax=Dendrobium chrysotoxum TaxID=161865 RepID=A0AAV7H080_DENCH|nr:hypothetical protein IEQ34_009014 [Dendrobium chrysotoxum]
MTRAISLPLRSNEVGRQQGTEEASCAISSPPMKQSRAATTKREDKERTLDSSLRSNEVEQRRWSRRSEASELGYGSEMLIEPHSLPVSFLLAVVTGKWKERSSQINLQFVSVCESTFEKIQNFVKLQSKGKVIIWSSGNQLMTRVKKLSETFPCLDPRASTPTLAKITDIHQEGPTMGQQKECKASEYEETFFPKKESFKEGDTLSITSPNPHARVSLSRLAWSEFGSSMSIITRRFTSIEAIRDNVAKPKTPEIFTSLSIILGSTCGYSLVGISKMEKSNIIEVEQHNKLQKLDKVSADVTTSLHLLVNVKQEQKEHESDFYKTCETGSLPKNGLIGQG